jgi:hypothetical protein
MPWDKIDPTDYTIWNNSILIKPLQIVRIELVLIQTFEENAKWIDSRVERMCIA